MTHVPETPAQGMARATAALTAGRPLEALAAMQHLPDPSPYAAAARAIEGVAYLQIGRPWLALSRLSSARGQTADPGSLAVNLALAHLQLDDAPGAIDALRGAGSAAARLPQYWEILTGAQIRSGRFAEALEAAGRAQASGFSSPNLIVNRVTALLQSGRAEEALGLCEDTLRAHSSLAELQVNRALALAVTGRIAEALDQAIAVRSEDAVKGVFDVIAERAAAIADPSLGSDTPPGDLNAALAQLRGSPPMLKTLAERLLRADRPREALEVCGSLPEDDPESAALRARGLATTGRVDAAEAALRAGKPAPAGAAQPRFTGDFFGSDPRTDARTLFAEQEAIALQNSRWENYTDRVRAIADLVEQSLREGLRAPLNPFMSLSLPFPPDLQRRIAESHAREYAARSGPPIEHPAARQTEVLHLGYLSADFRNHPTAHLIQGLFGLHDRSRFRVTAYALKPGDDSPYHRRISRDADAFVALHSLDDDAAARRIADDGVHILIDLMGYTDHGRPALLARRPAPLQINFLGMFGSIGAEYVDYLVADPVVIPQEHRRFYHEPAILLPVSCQVADSAAPVREAAVQRRDEDLPETGFVFCSVNHERKYTPDLFDSWARILAAVPDSVLWLMHAKKDATEDRLKEEMRARGVDSGRLVFAARTLKPRHLRRMGLADLFLDSFVFNAATTAVDSLLAGLPLITLRGPTFQSRISSSLLADAGLPELITDSREDYENLAIRLARDPAALGEFRARLVEARRHGRLLSTERFVRHLESGFELAWQRAVAGLRPDWIEVPAIPTGTGKDQ